VSFGKDSLAMLLLLMDKKYPLDEVVFYDTGMEFKAIYNIANKISPILEKNNIKFTILHPKVPFLYTAFEHIVHHRDGTISKGYSWCGGRCRWGTSEKISQIEKYCKGAYEYVGIAADETKRIAKERKPTKLLPLVELGFTEAMCLKYCRDKGYTWLEDNVDLYDILSRVSCWCCANKNLAELKQYYLYLPKYWGKLKDFQSKTDRPMKGIGKSIFDLEKRFERELKTPNNLYLTLTILKMFVW
jgi:3'-phosphoadenosine 5'-phosphosulfate sulfotransferase (PAPS reductase)/FAD synthetase